MSEPAPKKAKHAPSFVDGVKTKASDLLVQALENEGVEYVIGIPGEENLDFVESLRNSKIKLLLTRHEQAAGFMAATIGRLTGHPGVCVSTLGPGATNFSTAAAYAHLGAFPMVMITGQKPIKKSKQGSFQIINIVEHFTPMTKFTRQIVNADLIPSLTREAFRLSMEERPGAVHLELPEDIAEEIGTTGLFEVHPTRRPIAEEKAIKKAVDMICASKHPLLVIGAGANRKETRKMLTAFVEEVKMPFVNTQMGKGVVDERSPHFLGTAALSANDFVHLCMDNSDLIIQVGGDVVEKPPFFMHKGKAQNVIHVNFYSAKVDEVYFPQHEVVGDIANAIWAMKEELKKRVSAKPCGWNMNFFNHVKKELEGHLLDHVKDADFPMMPQRVVHEVRKCMPDDGMLCLDNGMYKIWFARNYKAYNPNTILLDNALATMGAGLPSALAAKMVYPHRKVVAVCGDGGFMMNNSEMETAVRMGIDLVVLLLNDNAFGMIRWKQNGAGFEDWGLNLQNPDFVKYAEAYGAHGHRVESADDFEPKFKKCLNSRGIHLLEVPINYANSNEILNHWIKDLKNKIHPDPKDY